MKKIILLLFLSILTFNFVSCSKVIVADDEKKDTPPKHELEDWETVKDSITVTEDEKATTTNSTKTPHLKL